jgi:hypothetical protein
MAESSISDFFGKVTASINGIIADISSMSLDKQIAVCAIALGLVLVIIAVIVW